MRLRKIIIIFSLVIFGSSIAAAEVPKVKFFPTNELTFCKGCFGHFNGWSFKYRLENHSGRDLIVYGTGLGKEFNFVHEVQYRNPDICEWQYGYGSSDRRCDWKCKSSYYKSKIVLKAGGSIETTGGILDNNTLTERGNAFIASDYESEPHEIFSDPYTLVRLASNKSNPPSDQATLQIGTALVIRIANSRSRNLL